MSEMTVQDAEQEAAEAEKLAGELEERVRQGDETVTPEAIEDAERLGRFARLRVEAARRKAEARRRAAALEVAEDFKARLIESAASKDGEVVEAFTDLVAALRRLAAAGRDRWDVVAEQVHERSEVAMLVRTDAGVELAELGVLPGRYGAEGYQVPEQGVDVRQVAVHEIVAEAIALGLSDQDAAQLARTGPSVGRADRASLPKMPRITAVVGWPAAVQAELDGRSR